MDVSSTNVPIPFEELELADELSSRTTDVVTVAFGIYKMISGRPTIGSPSKSPVGIGADCWIGACVNAWIAACSCASCDASCCGDKLLKSIVGGVDMVALQACRVKVKEHRRLYIRDVVCESGFQEVKNQE